MGLDCIDVYFWDLNKVVILSVGDCGKWMKLRYLYNCKIGMRFWVDFDGIYNIAITGFCILMCLIGVGLDEISCPAEMSVDGVFALQLIGFCL